MPYEMLVGLEVVDDEIYAEYRAAMTPILERFGGGFRYDFTVSKTLKAQSDKPINRVFTIHFESEQGMRRFFSDPDYLKAKSRFFEKSVKHTTIIAQYDRPE